jgi:hypothetical protein
MYALALNDIGTTMSVGATRNATMARTRVMKKILMGF